MLVTKKNTEIFEAVSEVDGMTVMSFKAEIDHLDPDNSSLDVKKDSESLYRQYRDQASADRAMFQDDIFAMIDRLKGEDLGEKDTTEVLEGIADHWNQLGDDEKNGIVDALAGIKEVTDDAEN